MGSLRSWWSLWAGAALLWAAVALGEAESKAVCRAQGDPHYTTFDGRHYNMMGTCTYSMVELCGMDPTLPAFAVEAKNEHRTSRLVSYVGLVTVRAYSQIVMLARGETGFARINNQHSLLPVSLNENRLRVYQSGTRAVVELDFGLVVTYDWDSVMTVTLPDKFKDQVCGLCGNYNGNPDDDFLTFDGVEASNAVELANSWKLDDGDYLCDDGCLNNCPSCSKDETDFYEGEFMCGLLTMTEGPFSTCHEALDPTSFMSDCVYDLCAASGDQNSLCRALSAYAQACMDLGFTLGNWRSYASCPMSCPENSKYNSCGPACPETCNPDFRPSSCSERPCVESCECLPGFVASGGTCIPQSSCGCSFEGHLLAPGQEMWTDDRCRQRCTCNGTTLEVSCINTQGCPPGESCRVENELLGCYPGSFATCQASGDPHYVTFDGRRYDFMGACVYLLAGSCNQNSALPEFRVLVENEHRGSQAVSYTRAVRVEVYGVELVISKDYPGQVMVDGLLQYPPFDAADGHVQVNLLGNNAAIRTDFSLTVTFNWDALVTVKVPSSYTDAMCGLCGNFNEDPNDDLTLRNGSQTTDATDFGNSWQEEETGPGCEATGSTECPNLDEMVNDQVEKKEKCGILADPAGPFEKCHKKLDPQAVVRDCVYDLCLVPDQPDLLCDALAAYAAMCQTAGVTLDPWRSETLCPFNCTEHSHYEACAQGCPLTCGEVLRSGGCGSECYESCVCDDGYLLSGNTCVPIASCGCVQNGAYYPPGQTFYPGPKCDSLCTCQAGGQLSCEPSSCGPQEICQVSDGALGCVPVSSATCQASGDPHYVTFDGRRYDFMGACVYLLAGTCGSNMTLPEFRVLVENEHRGSQAVSYTGAVRVEVYGVELVMSRQKPGQVMVDGVLQYPPFEAADGRVQVNRLGNNAVVHTDFGLTVTFNWDALVTVKVPSSYADAMCGLCGNFNWDPNDDLTLRNGSQATNALEFGNSWQEEETGPGCDVVTDGECPNLDEMVNDQVEKKEKCGILADPAGPFRECHQHLDPQGAVRDCVYDLCLVPDQPDLACDTLVAYAAACQAAGATVYPWRNETFCPSNCPEHSHYEVCAQGCQPTCGNLTVTGACGSACYESCVCDDGFVLSGNSCVAPESCGCVHDGIYHPPGQTFYPGPECDSLCTCQAGGQLSCEPSSCSPQEICQVSDGALGCVPVSSATCQASGDPHYVTFDGRRYDFMGACVYLLAGTCGSNMTLPEFRVLVENEHRGSQAVSYTGAVRVEVYGVELVMSRQKPGQVMVDGVLQYPPFEAADGRVQVNRLGNNAVVHTDFGLTVTFNWDALVTVKVPSSYTDAMCGLCGNFNEDPNDDLTLRNGSQTTDATDFGNSWQEEETGPGCEATGSTECPNLDEMVNDQVEKKEKCGILADPAGPFRECHQHLDPQGAVRDCVYDLCLVPDQPDLACDTLVAYAAACQAAGATVYPWRNETFCPSNCPEHSHYEVCAQGCQPTCGNLTVTGACGSACYESCVCDDGFVLSGNSCVAPESCGCVHDGIYHSPGQTFYPGPECDSLCTCQAGGQLSCEPSSCGPQEICQVSDGALGCVPVSSATCQASGDPHYVTFDGRRYDFMGACVYLLAGTCGSNMTLPEFRVLVENEHRGSQAVSYTGAVRVEVYGVELVMSRQKPGQVMVDGVLQYPPFEAADGRVQVNRLGNNAVVHTDFGLTVTFNWDALVTVKVPSSYTDAMCGLCGNFNEDPNDDLTLRNGSQTTDATDFGNSWQEEETGPGCEATGSTECPNLDEMVNDQVEKKEKCGILADPAGPFRECHQHLDPQGAVRDCVYDLCLVPDQPDLACDTLVAYAAACQAAGATVYPWRNETFCPSNCPEHSHYEVCAQGCQPTCGNLTVTGACGSACYESCVCDDGFVLSGNACVAPESCGCVHDGIYHPPGQTFYPGPECDSLCTCQAGGQLSCEPSSCGPQEICQVSDGALGCVPVSSATCQASGDPHYVTFDGRRYDFMGACVYLLAGTCGSNMTLPEFRVLVENEHRGSQAVSYTGAVRVEVYGVELVMSRQKPGQVMVDGVLQYPPFEAADGRVQVNRLGNNAVVHTDFGLTVTFNWDALVTVKVPSSYTDAMCGLCGNFNEDPNDDLTLRNGSQTTDATDFGNSWQEEETGPGCEATGSTECPNLDEMVNDQVEKKEKCGILADPAGPFRECHQHLDPQGAVRDCVYDLCLVPDQPDLACDTLVAYAAACQAAGATVYPWRNETFCPSNCPEHSHYEVCAQGCQPTCGNLTVTGACGSACYESCVCDDGFVLSGNACVAPESCGCVHDGIYHPPGQTFYPGPECDSLCTCQAGGQLSCEPSSCGPQEICQVSDGALGCVPVSSATCQASGDPHYVTFDGRRYDFMGACVYLLAGTCGSNMTLPEFRVLVENEHRGSQAVSYTGAVRVEVYGVELVMSRQKPGQVMVDGVLQYPPFEAADGRVQVNRLGNNAVVHTDFGLTVTFNWDALVTVKVPSSYTDAMCGLCGNFNEDPNDDLTLRNGSQTTDATDFGNSWQEEETGPGCEATGSTECPNLDEMVNDQVEKKEKCGILADPAGPFRECHQHLDPQGAVRDCVYDLCLVPDQPDLACDTLVAYAAACQAAGATVYPWRNETFCPSNCPEHSHYEVCAQGCQPTCGNLTVTGACGSACYESCVCDDGFVLSGNACVAPESCGCVHDGIYHPPGQTFYPGPECDSLCTCQAGGQLSCEPSSCGPQEICQVSDGALGCVPVSSATCQASGDPHYVTFDGRRYDFMGACVYLLAGTCGSNMTLPEFRVLVENEHRGSQAVSYTGAVRVEVYGVELVMSRQKPGQVMVDGVLQYPPFEAADGRVQVNRLGNNAVVHTDFGLTVTFNWDALVTVKVPSSYADAMCGLCGNFNEDPNDDLTLRNGSQTTDATDFGNSWQEEETGPGCEATGSTECPNLDEMVNDQVEKKEKCGILADPAGPFRECHQHLDPQGAVRDCVYDLCLVPDQPDLACDTLVAYAAACQAAGATVYPWRNETFCPSNCPEHSHYEVCAQGCQPTCGNLTVTGACGSACYESCVCDDGFVLSGNSCVAPESCGCVHDGIYHPPGQTFYPGPECDSLCTCQAGGQLSCEPSSCGPQEICQVSDGALGCVPVSSATCQASGDPHYVTFDGRRYDFMGACVYLLAGTCGSNITLPEFRVLVENEHRGSQAVSYTGAVRVEVYGVELVMSRQKPGQVMVDGVLQYPPFEAADGRVQVNRLGNNAVVHTDFGLTVTFNWDALVTVKVPSSYADAMCGLCGNFNEDPNDDLTLRNGSQTTDATDFGNSWQEEETGPGCEATGSTECPNLDEMVNDQVEKKEKCGILADPAGPFRECHQHLDPQGAVRDCVYDLCLVPDQPDLACDTLVAYAAACQAAGATVYPWRNETFCPSNCPEHSHYEVCAQGCQPTCGNLTVTGACGSACYESCVCDDGFVLSGNSCVAPESCGCVHDGIYHPPGQTFYPGPECDSLCTCQAGGQLSCEPSSCGPQEICQVSDGALGCVPVSSATCQASGDPHYVTFDGRRYDFMGACVYLLAGTCGSNMTLPEFRVLVENEHRGSQAVSYTGAVRVEVYGVELVMSRQKPGQVMVDGVLQYPPFEAADGRVQVNRLGNNAVVHTDFGLTVTFNWDALVTVKVPSSYADAMCGLCGNFNEDPNDDLTLRNGSQTTDATDFGNSWQEEETGPGCEATGSTECPNLDEMVNDQVEKKEKCGILADPAGPFRECHQHLDPQGAVRDCVYDLCLVPDQPDLACDTLVAYAAACQAAGATVYPWRNETFCPSNCPEHSHYEVCAQGCQPTCGNLTVTGACGSACYESCVCDDGFVLSGNSCVAPESCGCVHDGIYHPPGQTFYPGPECDSLCTCQAGGQLSCEPSSCGPQEICQVSDGALGCVPVSSATCQASGDPHYVTFDGRRYDFMGACVYLLAGTCGSNMTLPEFRVLVENEHRGSQAVSYTGAVRVEVYGMELVMSRQKPGQVMVDGVLQYPPFEAAGGHVQVNRLGNNAVVHTDFGLTVTFNWDALVTVKVPSSYADAMCGLCGNFNEDPNDDLTLRNGSQTTDATDFGNSWQEEETGPGCEATGSTECPNLDEMVNDQVEKKEKCGILADPAGPFRECHQHLDPQGAVRDCVYDLCLVPDQPDLACDTLVAYAAACQAAGATVYPWRNETFCPSNCPEHSHYEVCAQGCQPTCGNLTVTGACGSACYESCVCDDGFVLSGNSCVAPESCGCVHDGIYHPPGQTFYPGPECDSLCTCQAGGQLSCEPSSCGPQEICQVSDGALGCVPVSSATCQASGDPHYVTFDGRRYDFMGACVYLLAGTCGSNMTLPEFRVLVENEHRGSQAVSYTGAVRVEVYGVELVMSRQKPGQVMVDGVLQYPPFEAAGGHVQVNRLGNNAVVHTDFGLTVTFNWDALVTVKVPSSYTDAMCGLCGNFNEDPNDDLTLRNGSQTTDATDFGNSWQEEETGPGCEATGSTECPNLDEMVNDQVEKKEKCGILADPAGPFRECHQHLDPQGAVRDCVYDLCLVPDQPDLACDTLVAYAAACQAAGATVYPWRNETFCPSNCPEHSHYEVCAQGCQPTCGNLTVTGACGSACYESCVCDDGFVLSGNSCVAPESCGCVHDGIYHPPGQTFYPGPECDSLCTCQAGGQLSCEPSSCGPQEICQVSDGALGCVPVSSATCQASGDPHYVSFDGRYFDFMGTCVYVLAKSCGNHSDLAEFTVLQENEPWGNGFASATKAITVLVGNYTIFLEQYQPKVLVNGVALTPPMELEEGQIRIYQYGSDIVVETDFGLRVAYDLMYYVRVTVPGSYQQHLCGLCGDYNGNSTDDFQKPDGSQATNPNDFGNSWEEDVPGSSCQPPPDCSTWDGDICEDNQCSEELETQYKGEEYCGFLTSATGPLASCHALLDPTGFLKDCVFDLCQSEGSLDILCSNLHAYVSACQAAGGQVDSWRNDTFCPLKCPPNSHYELCADTCSQSCSARNASLNCPDGCAEGCQCNPNFFYNGTSCVPAQECGCYHNGINFEPEQTVLIDNCQQECVCHEGVLTCQAHSCEPGQLCQPSGGVLSCVTKDPCEDVTCPPQSTCKEQNGQGVCVSNSGTTCWLWGDPHYHSFDGYNFDFQGTCSYVLAEVGDCPGVDAGNLTHFAVTTKNENRGNPSVSFVKLVTVTVLDMNISIHKGEIGKVRVNGVLTTLPASLADGQITVTQGVSKAVLVTDFGLQVTYDWDWRVEVTLPNSYLGAVCGLCGNMDGDPSNDQVFPNGTAAPSIPDWGGSWQTPDWDSQCWDECQGSCPTCSEDQKKKYQGSDFCGPLAPGIEGLFSKCHSYVPPDIYFEGCVLDVCLGGGDRDILCKALAAYAALCQAAGAELQDWRKQLKCEITCPDHSHYELCGSPCPATCSSPENTTTSALCQGPCVEGCQCDAGFVLSGDRCVSLEDGCGCWENGIYYERGSEFWTDATCSERCRCEPACGSLICMSSRCGKGEECALQSSGEYSCQPESIAECQAWGDPHYVTLDGHQFDFQGACEYLLSAPCSKLPEGTEKFNVTVANQQLGSQAVSYTHSVTLYIYGHSLTLSASWPQQLQVDGRLVTLPYQLDSRLNAYLSGIDVVVTTAAGISLSYGDSFVRLHVPSVYAHALCGLCGNYNQDPSDDLTDKKPEDWQVGGEPGCGVCESGSCPEPCTPEEQEAFRDACSVISDPKGPLAPCHSFLPPEQYFQGCLLDACQTQGHESGLCTAVASYVTACQAAGAQLEEWRQPGFCAPQCPAHSHYELCGDSCSVSCPTLSAPEGCKSTCREGCFCDAGYVLSGDTCVPLGQCGCLHEGQYYPLGATFYPGPECERYCECGPDGLVSCQEGVACGPYEECKVQNGIQACYPNGSGHCLADGGIHYVSLDGHAYDLHGSCSYILAQVCQPEPGDEDFTIILEKDAAGEPTGLLVTVADQVVSLDLELQVTIDGEEMALPAAVGHVRVTAEGRNLILQTTGGLRLLLNSNAHVLISIPSTFHGRVCGLCGNFNGNWTDDFVLPGGTVAPDADAFGAEWRAPGSSQDCSEGCGTQDCPTCSANETAAYESSEICGKLLDANGTFASCHEVLSPSEYFRQCVYNLCSSKGDMTFLCHSLAAYVADCQAAGVTMKPWRTDSFCPAECPAHSHYSLCTNTCQGSCSALSGLTGCTSLCFEGCECDDRYLLSDGVCIPIQDCGCTYEGRYMPVNTSLLSSDCSESCYCSDNGLTCSANECQVGFVCDIHEGTRVCQVSQGLCSLTAGSNLTTFDGALGAFSSPGVYDLSSRCPGLASHIPWYRVVAAVQSCEDKAKTVVQIHVFFEDGIVTVIPGKGVWVNGLPVALPVDVLTSVSVSQTSDGSILVQQKAGVSVWLGTDGQLTVAVSDDHAGVLCGACGNFDRNPANDLGDSQEDTDMDKWRAPDFSPCEP